MKYRILLCIAFCALGGMLSAQDQATDWFLNKPISDIRFDGLVRTSANDLVGVTKPFITKNFTEPLLLEIQNRLLALDIFDYLEPDALPGDDQKNSVIIKFTVKERPAVNSIILKGNSNVRSSDILAEVTLKAGAVLSKAKITSDTEAIRKLYIKNGYAKATITTSQEPGLLPNTQNLIFNIVEGFKTTVRAIKFSGNVFYSEGSLKGLLKTAEQSLFNNGQFLAENLQQDKDAILKFYRDNGFIDANVADVLQQSESVEAEGRTYLTLTYVIEEGQRWKFGGITVDGNELFDTSTLLSDVRLKPNEFLNFTKLQNDYQRIVDHYYANGYINNSFTLDPARNEDEHLVSYVIHIVERGKAYIEDISIRGNTKTKDYVILRELPFETGDVFSAQRIREGLSNLANRQFFSDLSPETPAGSTQGLYDLVLNVTEKDTTDMRVGFSLSGSSEFPISGIFYWADTNFQGIGDNFALDVEVSPDTQKLTFSLSDPWLFGERWGGGANISFERGKKTGVPQDILGPTFSTGDANAVPDPFLGIYVFKNDTTYNSVSYKAGDAFPGVPSSSDITQYNLVTDYQYAGGSTAIPSGYTMEYINWDFSLGLNTSVNKHTAIGWFGFSTSASMTLNYVEYDPALYRPFSDSLRKNLDTFVLIDRLGLTFALDNRDLQSDPSNGYLIKQGFTYTGGILGGAREYIQSDTTLQGYLTLWNIPITDTANFKSVLAANATLSVLFPQFWNPYDSTNLFSADGSYLFTSPLMIARGWPAKTNGEALFNSWVELRTPIIPGTLSFDLFFDAVQLVEQRANLFGPSSVTDWMFGFGAGFRLTIPSLPLRLYLGKRFGLDGSGVPQWQSGNLFADSSVPGSGLDIILTFSF